MRAQRQNFAPDALIRAALSYDPSTGKLTWLIDRGLRGHAGAEAGCLHKKSGYIRVGLNRAVYPAHQLAWFLMTGEWTDMIDHENRDKADNRWVNLRPSTKSQNMANAKKHIHTKRPMGSRLKGAYPVPDSYKWKAQINANKVRYYLGRFDTEEEAHTAYCEAARRLHGEFARTE